MTDEWLSRDDLLKGQVLFIQIREAVRQKRSHAKQTDKKLVITVSMDVECELLAYLNSRSTDPHGTVDKIEYLWGRKVVIDTSWEHGWTMHMAKEESSLE